ncbi:2TM domain-containing protein [Galbibacter sp. EGI 63066]|uniref:2TM domain-containing protein n=1 Tax=Galbibacter sp. EGI 63066 TaxID=2993559 RepID=UPI002248F242|nr:2TM domain-containing protein [Galbibacter sp. EGI 63066]MCX2680233.1 2TM domain-containing protein [Galbibacter sp. EGI 63066]
MIKLIREIGIALFIGVLLFVVLSTINILNGETITFDRFLLKAFLFTQAYTISLYLANSFFVRLLYKKYEKELFTFRYGWIFILGSMLVSFATIFLLNFFFKTVVAQQGFQEFYTGEQFTDYIQPLIISVIIALLFWAFTYYRTRQETKVKEQKVIAGAATARFDALKNQLDPHFLFNSLNVLTSLIDENPEAAQKFTTGLSKVYRYVLEQKNKELVTLEEELQFAKVYMGLLHMRFENSIDFQVSDKLLKSEARVVPLSLQLLLENAVKHNKVTASKPLQITISEENNYLVVSNHLQPKEVIKKSSGVGLNNIRQRYGLLTNRKVLIEKTQEEFKVKIPMLTKQVSTMDTQQEAYIDNKRYKRAKERVENIKGFYANLTAYLIVIPCLAWLNYQTTGFDFPWVIFPILGWGFGLTMHAMEAFGYNPLLGKGWEERKIKEYMEKDK